MAASVDPGSQSSSGAPFAVVGDAAFLACSWTWCIGMFLPALLLRDMGSASFLVFALPNCLGAAAFASWLRTPDASRAFVALHARAIRSFSYVTIAFQWFFAAWMLRGVGLSPWTLLIITAGVGVYLLLGASLLRDNRRRIVSAMVWLASVALLVLAVLKHDVSTHLENLPPAWLDAKSVAPMFVVCLVGFSLCPLLDGTFHLVLQRASTPTRAKATFAVGFLVFFLVMIVGTLFYGAGLVRDATAQQASLAPAGLSWLVLAHVGIQLAFTLAAHERALPLMRATSVDRAAPIAPTVSSIIGIIAALLATMTPLTLPDVRIASTEVVYRTFMAFYGLVFPVYALACVAPIRPRTPGPTPPRIVVMLLGIACAGYFYYQGFVQQQTQALWIGVPIALATGLIGAALPGPRLASPTQP